MMTKKRTPTFGLALYAVVLPLVFLLLMAFSTKNHLQIHTKRDVGSFIEIPIVNDLIQQPSFGLPIDKKNNFSMVSGYGERMHPTLKVMRKHTGIDLNANEGIPVVSAEGGVVTKAELKGPWGNIVIIRHDETFSTSYSHLKSMKVSVGDKIEKGQLIGQVGHTGMSSKDHLHFEILKDGKAIDPIGLLPAIQ